MEDLLQYREQWEQVSDEIIRNQINNLESKITYLKNQLVTRNIPRNQFYNQYEDSTLQSQQLQHILKLRGYR